jgi:outer membrane protein OmpA-like peptidoglycan-associated protein/uncharacterized protein YidB (DUF937 family)
MSMLDGVIREVAWRFEPGDRAGRLVSALLDFMSSPRHGGIAGLVGRFRQAGLGTQVDSWLGSGPNDDLEPGQLERVMGRENVERVAAAAGVSPSAATPALAFLVPALIDLLTPDGVVPTSLPAGAAELAAPSARRAGVDGDGMLSGIRNVPGSYAGLRMMIPFLAILLLGFLGWQLLGRSRSADGGRQSGIAGADSIYTEPAAPPDPAAMPTSPSGTADPASVDPRATIDAALRRTSDAVAALRPGYSASELVRALNFNVVNFASGSAELPAESRGMLDQSAAAIRGAPQGTVLEVGGHTDDGGDASANQRLSRQRAEAVRAYLVRQGVPDSALTARGYGPARPVADNFTESGRFRNRRIEFTILSGAP